MIYVTGKQPTIILSARGTLNQYNFFSIYKPYAARRPHAFSRSHITHLFEAGLDLKQVQYLAGHATPEMTLRVYTHYREKQRAEETQKQVLSALEYLS